MQLQVHGTESSPDDGMRCPAPTPERLPQERKQWEWHHNRGQAQICIRRGPVSGTTTAPHGHGHWGGPECPSPERLGLTRELVGAWELLFPDLSLVCPHSLLRGTGCRHYSENTFLRSSQHKHPRGTLRRGHLAVPELSQCSWLPVRQSPLCRLFSCPHLPKDALLSSGINVALTKGERRAWSCKHRPNSLPMRV